MEGKVDNFKKIENTVNGREPIKVVVSKEEIIKALKILKGLQRTLQEVIKVEVGT